MSRSAEHSIQGYLYQFDRTLQVVLESDAQTVVTVEGIEDIDATSQVRAEAIQCKYHEGRAYRPSAIYKPLLQMLAHFCANPQLNLQYTLHVHFPDLASGPQEFTISDIDGALGTSDAGLRLLVKSCKGADKNAFLERFIFWSGPAFNEQRSSVQGLLRANIPTATPQDVVDIFYPNSLQVIADLGTRPSPAERTITKKILLQRLKEMKRTAISRWTREVLGEQRLLQIKKKQMSSALDMNSRKRHFLLQAAALPDFAASIVPFLSSYLQKYHTKPVLHNHTPCFCIDCVEGEFDALLEGLYAKGIQVEDGRVSGRMFCDKKLFREPIATKNKRDLDIRCCRLDDSTRAALEKAQCDDFYVVGVDGWGSSNVDVPGATVEHLRVRDLQELSYLLNLPSAL